MILLCVSAFGVNHIEVCRFTYLGQLFFTERTLWVVVQTSLQTLKTEGVTAGRRHRLIKKSGWERKKEKTIKTSLFLHAACLSVGFLRLYNCQLQLNPHYITARGLFTGVCRRTLILSFRSKAS